MGYILQVMPESPQPHRIEQAAKLLTKGQVAAVSTDTGFSLVCRLDDKEALDKIRLIRQLSEKKHFTLFCDSLSQMSKLARVNNTGYRMAKSVTPGPYTFILEATKEALHALLEKIGEPLVGTTVIMPGEEEPLSSAWEIQDRIGDQLAFILDDGTSVIGDTTVVDLSGDEPEVIREGLGSVSALGL